MATALYNADLPRSRSHARWLLAIFVLAAGFFVAITLSPWRSGFADAPDRGPGDFALYRAEVDRMRDGQPYYDAMQAELTERGYPTRSIFNWRTPLPVWLVGQFPETAMAHALLGLFGLALVLISFHLMAEEAGPKAAILVVLLLSGALLPAFLGDLILLAELWSGVLLALSAVCYGIRKPAAGIVLGLAALFFRELAAPYCVLCMALAARERNLRELAGWGAGLAAYALYFAWHTTQVVPRIGPDAIAHTDSWICFGGAGFLISTAQMNAYLLLVPQWVTALYLACALLGAATWATPAGRRIALAVALYALAFSIAGHDFNQYWGSQIAPLLCLPVARAPGVLVQLWRQARGDEPLAHAAG